MRPAIQLIPFFIYMLVQGKDEDWKEKMRQLLGFEVDTEVFESHDVYRQKKRKDDVQDLHEDKYLKEAKEDMRLKCRLHLEYELVKKFKNFEKRELVWKFRKMVYIIIFAMKIRAEVQKSRRRENFNRQICGENPTMAKNLVLKVREVLEKKRKRKQEKEFELTKNMSATKRDQLNAKKAKLEFLVKAGGEERAQEEEDDEEDIAMELRRRKNAKPKKRQGEIDGEQMSSSDSEDFYFNDNGYLKSEFKKMHRNELDEEQDRKRRALQSYDIQLFPQNIPELIAYFFLIPANLLVYFFFPNFSK